MQSHISVSLKKICGRLFAKIATLTLLSMCKSLYSVSLQFLPSRMTVYLPFESEVLYLDLFKTMW